MSVVGIALSFPFELSAAEKLSLSSLFTDHAVLQRDIAIPVWGKAEPGLKVVVQFAGQEKPATADKEGKWSVKLDSLAASAEGRTLTVKAESGTESVVREDVLVGEVWLYTGHIPWELPKDSPAPPDDPQVRLFEVPVLAADQPQESVAGRWLVGQTASVAHSFAQDLRARLKVPIGIVKATSVYGRAETWTPHAVLEVNPLTARILADHAKEVARFEFVTNDWATNGGAKIIEKHREYFSRVVKAGKAEPSDYVPPKPPDPNENPARKLGRPSALYNGMIAPIVPYGIRGWLCSNGEGTRGFSWPYHTGRNLIPSMITAWRNEWNQGSFPIVCVPGSSFEPGHQMAVQTISNTVMVPTVDLGGLDDVHPEAGRLIAQRVTLAARVLAYGEAVECSGPEYDSITIHGKKAILHFKHVGGGLVKRATDFEQFQLCGADHKFKHANAEIVGNTIVVSNDDVLDPVQVNYGFVFGRGKTRLSRLELWNQDGFPAAPFISDNAWPLEPGFESLFNGTDLTGWHYANGPEFKAMQHASDGRYTARDGRIVVNPGKGLAQMWTTREFPNDFHLKLEFRAGVNADSGIFIRKPQLQCRDYYVAGPYKELKKYQPQEWNEIEVIVKGNVATCTCNGEELKFTELPMTGPIGLEADRGQMEYRRIRIKEMK